MPLGVFLIVTRQLQHEKSKVTCRKNLDVLSLLFVHVFMHKI